MSSLQVLSRNARRAVAAATFVALSGLSAGCTGEPAPATGGAAGSSSSAEPTKTDLKKAVAKQAGSGDKGDKGNLMPEFPKK